MAKIQGYGNLRDEVKTKTRYHRKPFYDAVNPFVRYSELNDVPIPGNDVIQSYQLQKIAEFQKAALDSKANSGLKNINELFTSGAVNTITLENGEEISLQKSLTNIINNLNRTYSANNDKLGKEEQLKKFESAIKEVNNLLTTIQAQLNIDSIAYKNRLDQLADAMSKCNLESFNRNVVKEWIDNLNGFKGEVVEEIGTAWLRKRIPELNSITTGSLELRNIDNKKNWVPTNGATQGQFISDILMLNIDNISLLDQIEIRFKHLKDDNITVVEEKIPLKDFLTYLEKNSGSTHHIMVNDESYDTLMGLSSLNIQAKSGINQLPWNKTSKNTQVSIGEYNDEDTALIQAKHVFSLLHSLDNNEETKDWLKETSVKYNAIANYGLATVLVKTLHLSEHGNQFLLTPKGFVSYTDRLSQLFKTSTSIAKLMGNVKVDDNTLTTKYMVTVTGQKY